MSADVQQLPVAVVPAADALSSGSATASPPCEVAPTRSSSTATKPIKSYLLLYNVAKKQNFGQIIRSAMAFGVEEVGVVGAKKISDLQLFGNQGTSLHCSFRWFTTLEEAKEFYRTVSDAEICGIEIGADSRPVFQKVNEGWNKPVGETSKRGISCSTAATEAAATKSNQDTQVPAEKDEKDEEPRSSSRFSILSGITPFRKSTVFMVGNEGTGMNPQQMAVCDFFVYIPQHTRTTASLNVLVACSIVLHHFALFADFDTSPMEGAKFVVDDPPDKLEQYRNPSDAMKAEIEQKRVERAKKKQKNEAVGQE